MVLKSLLQGYVTRVTGHWNMGIQSLLHDSCSLITRKLASGYRSVNTGFDIDFSNFVSARVY